MTIYIVKIILRVLKVGANEYRQKGLIVKQRAAELLTTLEERLAKDDEKDHEYSDNIHHEISNSILSNKSQPNNNNNRHKKNNTNEISTEEKLASIAAELLVELIDVDCEPIKPYFPVLVLYAALYIDKPSNHESLHNLLVTLIVALSTNKTIEEIEQKSHSIDNNNPSLETALTSQTLDLLWDGDTHTTSLKQFVHNQGDYVAIDGAIFVKEYCLQFKSIDKPDLRTGYEALRWAVLSTNPEVTTRAFHIYKQLLNPLDHCTVKVMLLALCGAIDNWEALERSVSTNNNHNKELQEFIETQSILDTIIRMAEKLKELSQLYQYDSFLWTGIALLRANVKIKTQKQVFMKGLELLNIVLDDEDITLLYLFLNTNSSMIINSNMEQQQSQARNVGFHNYNNNITIHESKQEYINEYKHSTPSFNLKTQHSQDTSSRNQLRNYDEYKQQMNQQVPDWQYEPDDYDYEPSYSNNDHNLFSFGNTNQRYEEMKYDTKYNNEQEPQFVKQKHEQQQTYDIYSNDLAESFLSYCIDWSPPFEGIHPYLLQGLLEFDIEDNTFRVLKKVLTTKMDKLADRSSTRPCLCIVAIVPYMYYIIRQKPEYFATISHSLFDSLILLTSSGNHMYNNPYQRLKNKFEFWSNCPINSDNVNILLKEFCQIIVQTFFNEHAGLVANYLNALLSSKKMIHHHTTVYKMAALFLNEDANYIQAFKDIIESAHHSLTEKMSSKSGTPLLHSNASNSNHSNNHNSKHQQQISLPNLNNIIDLNSLIDDEDYISEMADAATELVATGIRYLKDREKQRFTKNYNQGDFESTQGGPLLRENTPAGNSINIIRWDVNINNVTPFPQTGLKDVSNALWGVLTETRAIV
eukprot:94633_1